LIGEKIFGGLLGGINTLNNAMLADNRIQSKRFDLGTIALS
jgi:hypothetical protein